MNAAPSASAFKTTPLSPSFSRPTPSATNGSGSGTLTHRPASTPVQQSTNGRVENPYLTSAYASIRPSTSGGGGDMYMSSRQKNNYQGKLKDTIKTTMAAMKQDRWKITCVKATNHDLAASKGKHVRTIMEGLRYGGSISNRESPAGGVFYHLRKRMMGTEWVVVIKSQTIFHHIFRDGNEKFVEYIATNSRSIFKMDFSAESRPKGHAHIPFIKAYGAYLEQWLTMKAAVNFPPGKSKEDDPAITGCYRQSSVEELLAAIPAVMDTVDSLLSLPLNSATRHTPVATPAFTMILRDLSIFASTLQESFIRLLDLFFKLDTPVAIIALDVYRRFVTLVGEMQSCIENAKTLQTRWQAPKLSAIPLDLMDSMQEYIDRGPQQDEPAETLF